MATDAGEPSRASYDRAVPCADAVVLLAGEGAEHLVVGAVLEHEDDEVLDLAVERLEGDARGVRGPAATREPQPVTAEAAAAAPSVRKRRRGIGMSEG